VWTEEVLEANGLVTATTSFRLCPWWPSAKAGWCGQYSVVADPHALVTQFFCKLMIVLWQSITEKWV